MFMGTGYVRIAVLQILQLASRETGKIPPFENILGKVLSSGMVFLFWSLMGAPAVS